MRYIVVAAGFFALPLCAQAQPIPSDSPAIKLARPSFTHKLIKREALERSAQSEFDDAVASARSDGTLTSPDDLRAQRVWDIFVRLQPHTRIFNSEVSHWNWQLALVDDGQVAAFCGAGGKVRVHSGVLNSSDGEVAFVLGHEMAHALREHSRMDWGMYLLGKITSAELDGIVGPDVAQEGARLLSLKTMRDGEREADLIGMELMARAGYDPRAAIEFWERMIAERGSASSTQQWRSTHPTTEIRIQRLQDSLLRTYPIYELTQMKER